MTPAGRNKIDLCAKALAKVEQEGLLKLPAKKAWRVSSQKVVVGSETDPEGELTGTARDVAPVAVKPVTGKAEMRLWNAYVQRYHGLGYRRPFGAHQRYFVTGAGGRRLGCLLFASAAWALAERDRWIGWAQQDRAQRLNWVVANMRFRLFPWVKVKNLASTTLSRVTKPNTITAKKATDCRASNHARPGTRRSAMSIRDGDGSLKASAGACVRAAEAVLSLIGYGKSDSIRIVKGN